MLNRSSGRHHLPAFARVATPAFTYRKSGSGPRHRLPNRRALGGRFAFILASSTISGLGDGVVYVALPLLAAQLTRDPAAISLLSAASAIPALAGGLFAGALVDRWSKPVVLFNIAMLQSLLCAAFAVWMQRQQVGLADLFAVGFVFATIAMFAAPAFTAFLPTLVPSEGLEKANSALSMGQALTMQLVGLPLGGLLATLSMELPWTVDALSFAIEGLLLFAVGRSARGRVDTAPLRRGLRELGTEVRQGLRLLAGSPLLRARLGIQAVTEVALAMAETVMVLYAFEVLQLSGTGFAVLLATLAVGCMVGAAGAPQLRRRFGTGASMTAGIFLMSCGMTLLGAFSSTSLSVLAISAVGFGFTVWAVVSTTMSQLITDDAFQGRLTSVQSTILVALRPIASAFSGLVASVFGLHYPYLVAALGLAIAGAAWLPALQQNPLDEALT